MRLSDPQRRLLPLIGLNIVLLLAALLQYDRLPGGVRLALAKSASSLYAYTLPDVSLDTVWVQNVALTQLARQLPAAAESLRFVDASRLTPAESRPWADLGCRAAACAHAIFYDLARGGTWETVVNLETGAVSNGWANELARPAGSQAVAATALAIAAADPQVQAVLGAIQAADQAMVPMSGWLADGACARHWCLDLTFMDPAGSGRIVHVFVNMITQQVDRLFYTRGRDDQAAISVPPMQRFAFTDDCRQQYGWQVCWNMTAHDGLLFSNASYDGRPVFDSAKIGQVEAWYPSWPGGYRDEIGFNASVPPFGDTQVTDLGDGFEVRQLFTEFTRWPNCICCYRYEQIMRFYADGAFEPRFVSHGPGCDDLSVYRPFWRIDLALEEPPQENVFVWTGTAWQPAVTEFELYPVADPAAPDGTVLGIWDRDRLMTWSMARTDPLGLDEARLFVLQQKPGEGDGPIVAGPGDTFQPPRQWLNDEPLAGQDVVVWFVPLLKTKQTAPLWCMPDPEPGLNQCEAILHIAPATALRQPTAAELTATREESTPTPSPTPSVTATAAPTATPRPIEGETAETLLLNAGCGSCHRIGELGEAHKVGPELTRIGEVAGDRVPGLSAEAYLRQSILEPNAFIAPECPNGPCLANIMPQDYAQRLTPDQLDQIVAYLLSGAARLPTPAPADQVVGAAGTPTPEVAATAKTAAAAKTAPTVANERAPVVAIQVLLVTLVLLLTLFRLARETPAA